MKQLLLDFITAPEPTFKNLVPGENSAAIQAARTLDPGRTMYVWGHNGCGRTHLLQAFAAQRQGRYLHARTDAAALEELAEGDTAHGAVAVDDVHLASDAALSALFRLYNLWRERGSDAQAIALVVSGDRAPMQMQCREDLRSRLGWGPVYRLMPLSDDEKLMALNTYAQERDIPLGPDIVRWLLTHGSRDIRILFDCVSALDKYSLQTHRAITLPLLKTMLAEKDLDCP